MVRLTIPTATGVANPVESKHPLAYIVDGRVEVGNTAANLAAMLRDKVSEAFDVTARRSTSVLEESANPVDACDLLTVVVPPVVVDSVDE